MTELEDFIHFKNNYLFHVDFETGCIVVLFKDRWGNDAYVHDVGATNPDGYIRFRLTGHARHRMKHRFLYWLWTGEIPDEVDHLDKNRSNNAISNLKNVSRSQNTTKTVQVSKGKTRKKLSDEDLHLLCRELCENTISITQLAKKYGISRAQIKQYIFMKQRPNITSQYFQ